MIFQITGAFLALMNVNLHGQVVEIPDPLTLLNGQKVASVADWQKKRRPEILEVFRREVYGRAPLERPRNLKFEVANVQKDAMNGAATRKQIVISFAGPRGKGAIRLLLFVPNSAASNRIAGAAPCFVLINHHSPKNADPTRATQSPF